ncbi:zinc dependent phospholipase C family protein [Pseudoalteromonas carrageenovora]|uniref:zinc dependent phospholipase C family protein n=1 Tax=Pseudoalteromonas carrageenovora TaxID=227 RepID=UPI0026E26550|nr:zinc dependent phospholipase C family protein [Pseudoalteromonas carrageenovora]MDO6465944.1 zinc dependent phospholipase C family protein [Pseudoalteromonas carrageenovora]
MPGAFAHITAANIATETNSLINMNIPNKAKLILTQRQAYVELGCVAPDYPYLAIAQASQNAWADLMHYERTGDVIKVMVEYCKTLNGEAFEKCFAWLCGYMAHVAADITIHPVVELKVGPYEQNKTAHRTCEMNQDAYIWQRLNLGEIGYADRIKHNMGSCTNSSGDFDPDIINIWQHALTSIHPNYNSEHAPNFNAWHTGFQTVVNNVEESYRLFAFARHVAADMGLFYPRPDEINPTFIEQLKTPHEPMHYNDIFDFAVSNIQRYITIIANAVFLDTDYSEIKNWNLDTGYDEHNTMTVWSK